MSAAIAACAAMFALAGTAHATPVTAFNSFVEQVNPQYQHAVGSTLYVNTLQAGSAEVRIDASDIGGITSVGFPALGTGWSPGAGTDTTAPSPFSYTYSWSTGAVSPGPQTATATATGGSTATAAFTITADVAAPSAGSISYPNGVVNGATISVGFANPIDAGSGLATVQIERRQATFAGGACAAWGAWANVGASNPASPWVDSTTADGFCYEYRLLGTDNVGNQVTVTSASTSKVDRTAPTGTIDGSPASPFSGTKTITGTATDSGTGVTGLSVTYDGPGASDGTICNNPAQLSPWSCPWNTVALPDGTYVLQLLVTDGAGNTSSPITRTVMLLNSSAPTGTISGSPAGPLSYLMGITGTSSGASAVTITYSGPQSGTACSNVAPVANAWSCSLNTSALPDGLYTLTAEFSDGVSSSTVTRTVVTDNSAPVGGAISATANGGVSTITFSQGTDASGVGSWQLERRSAPLVAGVCGAFGAWTYLGDDSAPSPFGDTTATLDACYEYRLMVVDNAGVVGWFGPTSAVQLATVTGTGGGGTTGGTSTGGTTTGTTGTTTGTTGTGTTGTTAGGGTQVTGTSGGERLTGTSGAETIEAGEGGDTIVASGGDDVIDGGPGIDTIVLSPCASTKVDLAKGTITGCGGTTSIRNVENVVGSPGADVITGGNAANDIKGGGGADVIEGGGGNDRINGGAGVDRIGGGGGRDNVIGGVGNDRLVGGAGDDRLLGGEGDDTIFAGAGDDDVLAGNGNDSVRGDDGNDHLAGANGDDVLVGGAGRDRLEGGPGRDRLDGGGGIDLLDGLRDV
jgi:hypothetical protein